MSQVTIGPENAWKLEAFKSQGILAAPITEYGTTAIPGFNPDALKALAAQYWSDNE